MRRLKITIIVSFLLFLGCNRLPKGYIKYQTFDEYKLKGVRYGNAEIKEPFVGVKVEKDSISVLICESFKKQILLKYINYGDYWFNLKKIQEPYYPELKLDTTPHYTERFIYNDTIMEYGYDLKQGTKKIGEELDFKTKKNIISLVSSDGFPVDKSDKFYQLKRILINYKVDFKSYEPSIYQKRYYDILLKTLVKDTLFIYDGVTTKSWKSGSLRDVLKLNSLGEFNPVRGVSILNDVLNKQDPTYKKGSPLRLDSIKGF